MNKFVLTVILLFYPVVVKANCKSLTSPNNILKCIVNYSPDIQVEESRLEELEQGIAVASQRPNLELDFDGSMSDDGNVLSEITILQNMELGDKRSARIGLAKKEKDLLNTSLLNQKDKIALQVVSDLYRFRQIEQEVKAINESTDTFSEITKQYSKAGQLNPENSISETIFFIALEENQLKVSLLKTERQSILSRIESGLGRKIKLKKQHLPKLRKRWPTIGKNNLYGSEIKKARTQVEVSRAKYALEKSEAYPDLLIGPKLELEDNKVRVGISFSLPLPLYHRNEGGRAKALAEVATNELNVKVTKSLQTQQREHLYDVYKRVIEKLSKVKSNKVQNKHTQLHKLIKRGVVSPSLVIELHRQIIEYYGNLHKLELEGVMAFWEIAALNGRVLKEKLL